MEQRTSLEYVYYEFGAYNFRQAADSCVYESHCKRNSCDNVDGKPSINPVTVEHCKALCDARLECWGFNLQTTGSKRGCYFVQYDECDEWEDGSNKFYQSTPFNFTHLSIICTDELEPSQPLMSHPPTT